jgi:hypothetical protein
MRSISRSQLRKTVNRNRNRNKRKPQRNKKTKNVRGGGFINMQEIPDGIDYRYEGQINTNKQPHGKGTMFFKNSEGKDVQYVGEWKFGKMDGVGTQKYKDNKGRDIQYVGEWESDIRHGMGNIQFYNKDNRLTTVEGVWVSSAI